MSFVGQEARPEANREARSGIQPMRVLPGNPFGVPPLHWALREGELRTAPQAADLATPGAPLCIDALASLIADTAPSPSRSIFEGVHRVPNDATLTIRDDERVETALHEKHIDASAMTAIDASNELWRLVLASVARSMDGAKRVAVLTGGGVDSGALLAAAIAVSRGANRAEVGAVTLHFSGPGDDRPYMREIERAFGIVAIRIDPRDCARRMRTQLDDARMPMWTPTSPTDFELVHRARESGADVAISGLGGDDLFDGYPRLLARDFFRNPVETSIRATRLGLPYGRSAAAGFVDFIARPLAARTMPSALRHYRRRALLRPRWPWAGPRLREHLDQDAQSWRPARLDTPTERYDYLARGPFFQRPIELFDELARRAGIRVAHPYLDHDLLALTCALPPAMLLHGDRYRGLFRLAARGHLPEKVRLRSDKASFVSTRREMFEVAGGAAAFRDLASMHECERLGLVDSAAFQATFASFDRVVREDDLSWNWIWPAIATEAFLRARARLGAA